MGILRNGRQSQEEVMDKQKRDTIHSNQTAAPGESVWNSEGMLRKEYLQELIEHGVDESAAKPLRFLLSKDFVLANLKRAEVDELKWLARWMAKIVVWDHPPRGSGIKGEYRKFLRDDPTEGKQPLSTSTQLLIEQFVLDVFSRGTRGLEGFQQTEMAKTYKVSEVKDEKSNKGGLFGGR